VTQVEGQFVRPNNWPRTEHRVRRTENREPLTKRTAQRHEKFLSYRAVEKRRQRQRLHCVLAFDVLPPKEKRCDPKRSEAFGFVVVEDVNAAGLDDDNSNSDSNNKSGQLLPGRNYFLMQLKVCIPLVVNKTPRLATKEILTIPLAEAQQHLIGI